MAVTGRTGWIATVMCAGLMVPAAAGAVSLKECSLKYNAAKTAGTLNGQDWKAFRASQCGTAATAGPTPVAATTSAAPGATAAAAPASAPAAKPPAAKAATGNATFPAAVNPKYAKLSAGKARMETCLDQYHANKGSGANGGLNWIAKNGYYSQCNTRLKGA